MKFARLKKLKKKDKSFLLVYCLFVCFCQSNSFDFEPSESESCLLLGIGAHQGSDICNIALVCTFACYLVIVF